MKVTIKEIAAKAGVSISAVSFALNDKPGVSQSTKELVHKIAKELGYIHIPPKSSPLVLPNGLVVKVLKIIRHGHTINASHNSFIDAYIEGLYEVAYQQGIEEDNSEHLFFLKIRGLIQSHHIEVVQHQNHPLVGLP
jgi:LacI family transcriptional regulator